MLLVCLHSAPTYEQFSQELRKLSFEKQLGHFSIDLGTSFFGNKLEGQALTSNPILRKEMPNH